MKGRLLALPVDARPVTSTQPAALARSAGWDILLPPPQWLGRMRVPGDRDQLALWMQQECQSAQGLIVSLDMLLYGGLVPSRLSDESGEAVVSRLSALCSVKALCPSLTVVGFLATMRISDNNYAEEERSYWADYGQMLFAWSYRSDRFACLGDPEDQRQAAGLAARIPEAVRSDYLATRSRNFSVALAVIDLVADGVIDRLILPQDDSAAYGLNVAERRLLEQEVARRSLGDRIVILPGADEVIWTQIAWLITQLEQRPGVRIALDWHEPGRGDTLVARYEDRPLAQTVRAQLEAGGARVVEPGNPFDVQLYLFTAGGEQGEWALGYAPSQPVTPVDPSWIARLVQALGHGQPCALVDLAHANGGDPALIAAVADAGLLTQLYGYAGWNTAGNSLGSIAAFCQLPVCDALERRIALATRLIDDFVYQAEVRQRIRAAGLDPMNPGHAQTALDALFLPVANTWLQEHGFADLMVSEPHFPWDRTFEIGFTMVPRSAGPRTQNGR